MPQPETNASRRRRTVRLTKDLDAVGLDPAYFRAGRRLTVHRWEESPSGPIAVVTDPEDGEEVWLWPGDYE